MWAGIEISTELALTENDPNHEGAFVCCGEKRGMPKPGLPELRETVLCQSGVAIQSATEQLWIGRAGVYWMATRTRASPVGRDPEGVEPAGDRSLCSGCGGGFPGG